MELLFLSSYCDKYVHFSSYLPFKCHILVSNLDVNGAGVEPKTQFLMKPDLPVVFTTQRGVYNFIIPPHCCDLKI